MSTSMNEKVDNISTTEDIKSSDIEVKSFMDTFPLEIRRLIYDHLIPPPRLTATLSEPWDPHLSHRHQTITTTGKIPTPLLHICSESRQHALFKSYALLSLPNSTRYIYIDYRRDYILFEGLSCVSPQTQRGSHFRDLQNMIVGLPTFEQSGCVDWCGYLRFGLRGFQKLRKVALVGIEEGRITGRDDERDEEGEERFEIVSMDRGIVDGWVEESKWYLSGVEGRDVTL